MNNYNGIAQLFKGAIQPAMRLKHFGLFIAAVGLFYSSVLLAADPAAEQRASIDKISKQINTLSHALNSTRSQRKTARDELLSTEQELVKSRRSIRQYNKQIEVKKRESELLKKRLEAIQIAQEKNKAALTSLLLTRYKNGQDNYLKQLLNQQNPYAVGRLANYHSYFSQAITARLEELQLEVAEITGLEQQYQTSLDDLELAKGDLAKQQQSLELAKNKRQALVVKLDKQIEQSSEKISALKADRDRLNTLVEQIAKQAELLRQAEQKRQAEEAKLAREQNRKPPTPRKPVVGGFEKQKSRLQYPSTGQKTRTFGSRIAASGMTSDGVFFSTKENQEVRSIYRGRVLFSDYLKGYGLLLIVDHGDDHISLYGHNKVLLKNVGDEVATNELISRSGVSGGLKSPGLYFEVRHNANPVDPAKWCQ